MAGDTTVLEPVGNQSFNPTSCSAAHTIRFKKCNHSPQMTNKRYSKRSKHSLVLMAYDPRRAVDDVWCRIMLCLDGNRKTDATIQLLPMHSHHRINKMNVYFSFISHNTGTFSQEQPSFDITQPAAKWGMNTHGTRKSTITALAVLVCWNGQ